MAAEPYELTAATANPPRNSTICITGGASGIGLATALFLHTPEYNNNVAIFDKSPSPPDLKSLTRSPRFLYIQCDILDWPSQRSAFSQTSAKFGRIDHVFINAGVNETGEQLFTDVYDSSGSLQPPNHLTLDIDLRALAETLKLALHHLRNDHSSSSSSRKKGSGKGRGGTIVLTASLAGYLASAGAPMYSAAKHGVVGFMRALKNDCAKIGVAISVVAPGITLTPLVLGRREGQSLGDWGVEMKKRGVPVNSAEKVAFAVAELMGRGKRGNGVGLLIQDDRVWDVEKGLARARGEWMGKEMLGRFKGGRGAALFPNKL